jgi:hypothetical protein
MDVVPASELLPAGSNPYWQWLDGWPKVAWSRRACSFEQFPHPTPPGGWNRDLLVHRYAWAIPSPATIRALRQTLAGRPLVEIGAGTGYWLALLADTGVDTRGYDVSPPALRANRWHNPKRRMFGQPAGNGVTAAEEPGPQYHPLHVGGPEVLTDPDNAGRVLLLCWPPYEHSMAHDALRAYTGDTLIYQGEGEGGCCADDAFFALLDRDWIEATRLDVPHWFGLHDYLTIYSRR